MGDQTGRASQRRALVTGAKQGLGAAIALRLRIDGGAGLNTMSPTRALRVRGGWKG